MTITKLNSQAIVAREPVQLATPNWSLEEVQIGEPGDDEVLVELYAAGICHTDVLLSSVPPGAIGVQYPKVVGHEGAGVARAVGKNVHSVEVGDPILLSFDSCSTCEQCEASHPSYCDTFVPKNYFGQQESMKTGDERIWSHFFGQSSFAQYSVASKSCVVNVKDLIQDLSELKLFAPLGCGFQTGMGAITNITQAGPDDIVMIAGLGAVGMGALMTAKITKCKAIIVVDRIQSRLELAKELGATHTIDTSAADFSTLDVAVRSLIPTGASIAVDTTGIPAIIEQSIQSTKFRGKMVLIGAPPFDYKLSFNATEHLNSGRSILGCIEGDCDPRVSIPQMIQWYREGIFPIDRLVQYFDVCDPDETYP
ncbi:NAD/NADP dependent alcohol dehydrogenase [Penicillium vulpinum]|uniref:NAD/NADP dependent alcohol dehydrogenase n=1 Tax=Penicillium vulpinum TaxID=29845 RepID=UPI00254723DA|nr:NAD/NADP dependent alcohol dehydrogenase [Penicillium vulpinum]KAJ5965127.1 NAD/NADP dependent alcohol dehydrogenase [Penicillium vulpinum]